MTGLWIVIDICVGMALGLLAGVPLGFVLGYERACDKVARPRVAVIPAKEAEKERKEA